MRYADLLQQSISGILHGIATAEGDIKSHSIDVELAVKWCFLTGYVRMRQSKEASSG